MLCVGDVGCGVWGVGCGVCGVWCVTCDVCCVTCMACHIACNVVNTSCKLFLTQFASGKFFALVAVSKITSNPLSLPPSLSGSFLLRFPFCFSPPAPFPCLFSQAEMGQDILPDVCSSAQETHIVIIFIIFIIINCCCCWRAVCYFC